LTPPAFPLIVSFYTDAYAPLAKQLEGCARRWGLDCDIRHIQSRGSWQQNTQYKAQFILEMMQGHPDRDILWLDADAAILAYPVLFDDFAGDVGVHYKDGVELLSGTLFLRNKAAVRGLVLAWIVENKNNPAKWDQANLQKVIEDSGDDDEVLVVGIPPEYTCIFDRLEMGEPVIEHLQASRQLKGAENAVDCAPNA